MFDELETTGMPFRAVFYGEIAPGEIRDHESRNRFQAWVIRTRPPYMGEGIDLWSEQGEEWEIDADDLTDACKALDGDETEEESDFEDKEEALETLKRAREEEGIPDFPSQVARHEADLYEAVEDYRSLIKDEEREIGVGYDYPLRAFGILNEELVEIDKLDSEPEIASGKSPYIVFSTIVNNFLDYVVEDHYESDPIDAEVRVDVYRDQNYVIYEVEDNGPGLPEDENLTEYSLLDGKGIPTADLISSELGGYFEIKDSDNGARFEIGLPCLEDQ